MPSYPSELQVSQDRNQCLRPPPDKPECCTQGSVFFIYPRGGAGNWVASSDYTVPHQRAGGARISKNTTKCLTILVMTFYCLGICWFLWICDSFLNTYKAVLVYCCLLDVFVRGKKALELPGLTSCTA